MEPLSCGDNPTGRVLIFMGRADAAKVLADIEALIL
jgi:hypothetical protein